ncbi:hypothetical protein JCM8547_002521 [Rhodosporidiobolus lusitaniae]
MDGSPPAFAPPPGVYPPPPALVQAVPPPPSTSSSRSPPAPTPAPPAFAPSPRLGGQATQHLAFAPPPPAPSAFVQPAPAPAPTPAPVPPQPAATTASAITPSTASSNKSQAQLRRSGVACTRCRRGKQRCVNDGFPPCQACVSRGCQDECTLGERGKSSEDRGQPRPTAPRKRRAQEDPDAAYTDGGVGNGKGPQAAAAAAVRRASISGSPPAPAYVPMYGAAAALQGYPPGQVFPVGAQYANGFPIAPGTNCYPPSAAAPLPSGVVGTAGGGGGGRRRSTALMKTLEDDDEDEEMPPVLGMAGGGGGKRGLREPGGREEGVLPSKELVIEGCEAFFSTPFQLTFLHRPSFLHKLASLPPNTAQYTPLAAHHPPAFLLLAILAVSARFCEPLVRRAGGDPREASEGWAEKAKALVVNELFSPSLERVQALYLLSLHEYGHGQAFKAKMLHKLARSMAEPLKLHEDVEGLSVVENESRRRTWWFLKFEPNALLSEARTLSAFKPRTVGAQLHLPSQETDWTFGIPSRNLGPPGSHDLSLLGAVLTVSTHLGAVAESASSLLSSASPTPDPRSPDSSFASLSAGFSDILNALSPVQQWSTQTLLAYRTQNLDLGFLSLWVQVHLVELLLRRTYLPEMIRALHPTAAGEGEGEGEKEVKAEEGEEKKKDEGKDEGEREYYGKMAEEMIQAAMRVIEVQEEVAGVRAGARGVTVQLAFSTFLASLTLSHLRLAPFLSPSLSSPSTTLTAKLTSALSILQSSAGLFPVAEKWHRLLWTSIAEHPSPSFSTEREREEEMALYRPYAPPPLTAATPGPTDAANAASALAALANNAVVEQQQQQQQVAANGGAKRFSAHLRQAAPASPALNTPASSAASSTPFIFSPSLGGGAGGASASTEGENEEDQLADSAEEGGKAIGGKGMSPEELLKLDFGDVKELAAWVKGE